MLHIIDALSTAAYRKLKMPPSSENFSLTRLHISSRIQKLDSAKLISEAYSVITIVHENRVRHDGEDKYL